MLALNRRALVEHLIPHVAKDDESLSVVCRRRSLKAINDRLGHSTGATCSAPAAPARQLVRRGDEIIRLTATNS